VHANGSCARPGRQWMLDIAWILGGFALSFALRWLPEPLRDEHVYHPAALAIVAIVAAARGALPGLLTAALVVLGGMTAGLPSIEWPGRKVVVDAGLFMLSAALIAMLAGRRDGAAGGRPGSAHVPLPARSSALLIAAGVLPLAFIAFVGWVTYRDAIESVYERLERTSSIAAEHLLRVVEVNRVIARSLLHEMRDEEDAALREREASLHEHVRRLSGGAEQIQSIWVWDAGGRPLVSSIRYPAPTSLDVSDREYFHAHRDLGAPWFVTHTLMSRTTGELFFDITARREVEGRFAGVISVSLRPQYFSDFYRRLAEAEPGLRIVLVRLDGALIARWPEPPGANERLHPDSPLLVRLRAGGEHGNFRGVAPGDGRVRHVVYQRTSGYPLYVAAGLDRDAILKSWYSDMFLLALVVFPASLGLVWLLFVAFERSERMQAALANAREEAEQRSRAEDALRHAQKLEALGLLTGGVAHDFNNLLAVVSNSAYLLRHVQTRRGAGEDETAPVAAISRAVESGTKLTRQLLAFSRRQPLAPEVVQVDTVLHAMMELLRTIVSRRIDLDVSIAADLPCVRVDPAELELAIINLVINARDAIRGSGRIEIEATAWSQEGKHYVRIGVRDDGIGIPADLRERVFEPFFTTKPRGTGTGLGLSQVYGFCTQAGGTVRLEPNRDGGTVVFMFLPATSDAQAEPPPLDRGAPPRIEARVLLVEDNDDIGTTMQKVLKSLGAEVTYAASGDDALRVLAEQADRFDLVVSDVAMPGSITGIELAQLCRQRWPQLAVVLMTGYTAELQAAVEDGFTVLAKPIVPDALARAAARELAGRRARS
jgi:two-component system NtrC family sensor kinase